MRMLARGVLAAVALTAAGCPYDTPEPLLPLAEAKLEPRLVGTWDCRDGDDKVRWSFARFDDRSYVVVGRPNQPRSKDDDGLFLARAHAGRIGAGDFLAVAALEEDPMKWMVVRYSLPGPDRLTFRIVDSDAFSAVTPTAEVRARLARDPDAAALYGDSKPSNCTRLSAP